MKPSIPFIESWIEQHGRIITPFDGVGIGRIGEFYIRYTWEWIQFARVAAFDRWANSVIYETKAHPFSYDGVTALLDRAENAYLAQIDRGNK